LKWAVGVAHRVLWAEPDPLTLAATQTGFEAEVFTGRMLFLNCPTNCIKLMKDINYNDYKFIEQ